ICARLFDGCGVTRAERLGLGLDRARLLDGAGGARVALVDHAHGRPEPQTAEHDPEDHEDRGLDDQNSEIRGNLKHEGWAGLRPGAAASGLIPATDTVLRLLGALGVCREAVARAIVIGEEWD